MHAPRWYKAVEHFHGGVGDVVFGDEMLLKNHVRQVNGVDLEPGNGSWPTIRHSNQDPVYGSSAYPKKISQTKRSELDLRWSTCSSTSRNRVTHLFAT